MKAKRASDWDFAFNLFILTYPPLIIRPLVRYPYVSDTTYIALGYIISDHNKTKSQCSSVFVRIVSGIALMLLL
jgi:hypothetical protein